MMKSSRQLVCPLVTSSNKDKTKRFLNRYGHRCLKLITFYIISNIKITLLSGRGFAWLAWDLASIFSIERKGRGWEGEERRKGGGEKERENTKHYIYNYK